MIDRPSGSYIEDPETGEIKPNLEDEAMNERQLIAQSLEKNREVTTDAEN